MEIDKRIHPQEIGLFSNIGLGNIWFPTQITPQMEGWTNVWKDLNKTFSFKAESFFLFRNLIRILLISLQEYLPNIKCNL